MSSTAAAIADQVVEVLTTTSLSLPIAATRAYVLPRDLEQLQGIQVTVSPLMVGITAIDLSRRLASDWGITVTIQSKPPDASPESIDPLMQLVEEIARLFASGPLPPIARCQGVENQPLYDAALLDSQGVFSSSLLFTFRTTR